MCRQMKGKIRLLFSYLSILVIGILIYLVVLFVADKHRKDKEMIADSGANPSTPAIENTNAESPKSFETPIITGDSSTNGESISESPSVADKESLNELPNEINVALDSIEKPANLGDSRDLTNADRFPRSFVVNTKILRIRAEPSTDSEVIKHFKYGAIIRVSNIEGKWAQLENGGWAYLPLLKEQK